MKTFQIESFNKISKSLLILNHPASRSRLGRPKNGQNGSTIRFEPIWFLNSVLMFNQIAELLNLDDDLKLIFPSSFLFWWPWLLASDQRAHMFFEIQTSNLESHKITSQFSFETLNWLQVKMSTVGAIRVPEIRRSLIHFSLKAF